MPSVTKDFFIRVKADLEKAVRDFKRLGTSIGDAGKDGADKLRDSSQRASSEVEKLNRSVRDTESVTARAGRALGQFLTVAAIVSFAKRAVDASRQAESAFRGLESVANFTGVGIKRAFAEATSLAEDGLLSVADASKALQNLLSRGYDIDQAVQTIERLKDAAAFNRQASLSLSQAVVSATEGLKNENSVLVDNAGVTKNVSKLWEEYADKVGKTVDQLTNQEKVQAEVNGILRETEAQAGNAARAAEGLEGAIARANKTIDSTLTAFGASLETMVTAGANFAAGVVQYVINPIVSLAEKSGVAFGFIVQSAKSLADLDFSGIKNNLKVMRESLADIDERYRKGIIPDAQYAADAVNEEAVARRAAGAATEEQTKQQKELASATAEQARQSRAALQRVNELASNRRSDSGLIADLQEEIRLFGLSERAQASAAAASRLSADATAAQRAEVDRLAGSLFDLKDGLDIARELGNLRVRLLSAQGNNAEADKQALLQEFDGLLTRLKQRGDQAGVDLVNSVINVETARIQLNELERQFNDTLTRMSEQEQRVQAENDAGLISELDARKSIVSIHKETSDELSDLLPKMRALASAIGPEAVASVDEFEGRVKNITFVTDEVAKRVNDALEGGLTDFFYDVATGAKSAGEAFRDFGNVVIDTLIRIAAEQTANQLLTALGSAGSGSAGSGSTGGFNVGAFVSAVFGSAHSGGIVGALTNTRAVSPLVFAGAPRFHSGGLVPGEVPVIAMAGEEILPRSNPRHRDNAGGGTGRTIIEQHVHIEALDSRDVLAKLEPVADELGVMTRRRLAQLNR